MELAQSHAVSNLLQRQYLGSSEALLTLQLQTLVSYGLSLLLGLHDVERVASLRRTVQTQYDNRLCRLCSLNILVTLIEHSLHTTPCRTGYHDVAHVQCTIAYKHCRDISPTLVK